MPAPIVSELILIQQVQCDSCVISSIRSIRQSVVSDWLDHRSALHLLYLLRGRIEFFSQATDSYGARTVANARSHGIAISGGRDSHCCTITISSSTACAIACYWHQYLVAACCTIVDQENFWVLSPRLNWLKAVPRY